MRNLVLHMSFFFIMISLLSCSHEDDYFEDYQVIDEHTVTDTINIKDSTSYNDTLIIVVDTISHKDSINNDTNTQNSTIIKIDTLLVSYEKYMNISPYARNGQGGACYDKYYFQGYAGNAAIGVYDLENKSAICKIDIPEPAPSTNIHVNTINFGSHRKNVDDFFPLLYVCSGYTERIDGIPCSFIYVYRIIKEANKNHSEKLSAELVQTITLKDFGVWTEGILDNDHDWLWIKYGGYIFAPFTIPNVDKRNVTIQKEDALMSFSIEGQSFTSSNQGHLYYDNKILLVSGISPNTQKLAYIVINTITQSRELVIDLAEIGLRDEPENVFFYNGQLMIGYRTAIYKFNVRPLSNN